MRPTVRGPRPTVALLGAGLVALAAIVIGIFILRPSARQVGDGSPTPAQIASAEASSIATITPPSQSPSVSPDPTTMPSMAPTPVPTPGPIVRWNTAASFGDDGLAQEVLDVAYGGRHFVAVGYREPLSERGQVGPSSAEPLIWTSVDGSSWKALTPGPEFSGAHLFSVVTLPDGAAGIYGYADLDPDIYNQDIEGRVWRSSDGEMWDVVAPELPPDSDALHTPYIARVDAGGRGYLSVQTTVQESGLVDELWYSSDGIIWESVRRFEHPEPGWAMSVRDVGAGDEGFVLVGESFEVDAEERVYVPFIQASSDGKTWIDADPTKIPTGPGLLVAPVRGDWIVTQTDSQTSTDTTWFSNDGIQWKQRAAIEVPPPAAPDDEPFPGIPLIGTIIEAGDRAFVIGAVQYCCHGPWYGAGIWSSFDATSWERLGFPNDAVISSAATHDGVTVLAGWTGATPLTDWHARATFWVSERD